jgi:hypothetical protein
MTGPAHRIHFDARHFRRIPNRLVIRTRAMTRLALHTCLGRLNAESLAQSQQTRRMALEALQDRRAGVESAVALAHRVAVSGRNTELT